MCLGWLVLTVGLLGGLFIAGIETLNRGVRRR